MKRWQNITLNLIMTIVLLAFGALLNVSYQQAHNIIHNYPADRSVPGETPADYNLTYEDVPLIAADGVHLAAQCVFIFTRYGYHWGANLC